MFQFPSYASTGYLTRQKILPKKWVAPFGHVRIKGCLAPPRTVSSPTPSFIASQSQGILRLLVLCLRSLELVMMFALTCKQTLSYFNNEIVFQSSSIDVLPLERTSIDFILSKNNENKKFPKLTKRELIGGPE
jgi:hypothetical protein